MPAEVRRSLGVDKKGDKLAYTYDEKNQQLIIKKADVSFEKLQKRMQKQMKPGIKPLENVGEYYQKNRQIT